MWKQIRTSVVLAHTHKILHLLQTCSVDFPHFSRPKEWAQIVFSQQGTLNLELMSTTYKTSVAAANYLSVCETHKSNFKN